jgi:hypothetical protein
MQRRLHARSGLDGSAPSRAAAPREHSGRPRDSGPTPPEPCQRCRTRSILSVMRRARIGDGSKTGFILGMPTASAKEVVDAAAKVGIKLTTNSVHAIRSMAKKRAGGGRGARPTRAKSNGKMTASDFVRGMPEAPARDVVAAAKNAGIKLSERYVYVIRSSDRAKARAGGSARGRGKGAENSLRQAIAELGLGRARQVLAEMESAFR